MTSDVGTLVVEASLLALSARERTSVRSIVQGLREGDGRLHAEYRIALAWAVHHVLRRDHPQIVDVYIVGSTLDERARISSDLDLVILGGVFSESDEDAFCEANRSISRAYRELVGSVPEGFELLDLHLVPQDLEHHPYRRLFRHSDAPHYRLAH